MEPPPDCANATASRSVASGMPRNSPGKVIFLPIMDGKWLRERISDIDAEIKNRNTTKRIIRRSLAAFMTKGLPRWWRCAGCSKTTDCALGH